ncbi:imidazole glycerol phosphate synthase subunit HisF, partial [candidate division KSB3 bacterium]|nr:imidazole glycerol phosphate synthase subunit HisF [candidate division KSB3 bacterium]MBD3324907.1 imidazole glycerol phosphate synthase subunit HisF [candidate division KSB3 bacterium]
LDIDASKEQRRPDFQHIAEICSESFIPFCYGGGIKTLDDAEKLFTIGVEKISLNRVLFNDKKLITSMAHQFGSQSIVAAMDVRKKWMSGYTVMAETGKVNTRLNPIEYARELEQLGAGELLINAIDRDGMMNGYDIPLMQEIASAVSIPVIACGGAGHIQHIAELFQQTQVSAAAAGSLFVFKGKHRAVLINYPSPKELKTLVT